jgi:hypothetical protein
MTKIQSLMMTIESQEQVIFNQQEAIKALNRENHCLRMNIKAMAKLLFVEKPVVFDKDDWLKKIGVRW